MPRLAGPLRPDGRDARGAAAHPPAVPHRLAPQPARGHVTVELTLFRPSYQPLFGLPFGRRQRPEPGVRVGQAMGCATARARPALLAGPGTARTGSRITARTGQRNSCVTGRRCWPSGHSLNRQPRCCAPSATTHSSSQPHRSPRSASSAAPSRARSRRARRRRTEQTPGWVRPVCAEGCPRKTTRGTLNHTQGDNRGHSS